MNYNQILKELKSKGDPKNVAGMARFGITGKTMYGVSMPEVRKLGKSIGRDHMLAQQLWKSGVHEARILASIVEEPEKVTEAQFGKWAKDFDSWDVCDQTCLNLFWQLPFAYEKCKEYSSRNREYEKRTAFALMAVLAWKDKQAPDSKLALFFPIIKRESTDERKMVKKSVNWALRQIGKRNLALNKKAIKTAKEIQKIDSKAAKWIANDAIRELESDAVQKRLKK